MLRPVAAPLPHRRNVTITGTCSSYGSQSKSRLTCDLARRFIAEIHDPALRRWSEKPAKTFNDILPSGYITAARSGIECESPTSALSEKFVQAAIPKVQGVVEIVRRRTTIRRPARGHGMTRSESLTDEKKRLLEEDSWEVVRKEDVMDGRAGIVRSKSEMRPSRYYSRK